MIDKFIYNTRKVAILEELYLKEMQYYKNVQECSECYKKHSVLM